jgi:hypothetical protein
LTFLKALKAIHLNRGKVREQILTTVVGCNKTKTLSVVKPLNCTNRHFVNPCKTNNPWVGSPLSPDFQAASAHLPPPRSTRNPNSGKLLRHVPGGSQEDSALFTLNVYGT